MQTYNVKEIRTLGFTLVELIVVISVLGILWTIGYITLLWYIDSSKTSKQETDLALIEKAITLAQTKEQSIAISKLTPVTFKWYPANTTSYIGDLVDGIFDDLPTAPVDPFTKTPYTLGLYTGWFGGIVKYWQVATTLINTEWNGVVDAGVRIQRLRWKGFEKSTGIDSLIPRWYLENPSTFKATSFYTSNTVMPGGTWRGQNRYTFALDGVPVSQWNNLNQESTVLYESFENMSASVQTAPGNSANGYKPFPACISNASVNISYEWNSSYGDQLQTVDCKIDKTTGSNSYQSLYLKWVRDSAWWDGLYSYAIIDPTKKYQYSFDVKWHLANTVDSWKLKVAFYCYSLNSSWVRSSIGSSWGAISWLIAISPSNFTTVSAYINSPDPSWNNLSITIPGSTTESTSCIFYRANSPKNGDELWFDNYTIKEIP